MKELTVDIESFSTRDITTVGSYRYIEDPEFQVLLLSYAADDGPVVTIDLMETPTPTDSVARANDLIAVRASEGRAELWAPADQAHTLTRQLEAQLPQAELNDWLLGQIRAGIGQGSGVSTGCCAGNFRSASRHRLRPQSRYRMRDGGDWRRPGRLYRRVP